MSNASLGASDKFVRKIFCYCVIIALSASALIVFSLKIYLISPYPARQLSTLLSAYINQPVSVQAVYTSGPRLYIKGLTIADPPGFSAGRILTAGSLVIKPHWGQLMLGRHLFRLIEIDGVKIDLHKNDAGVWNFAGLRKVFVKPAAKETLVHRLSVKNGSFKVNSQTVREISLNIQDLATKGSTYSRIELTFKDDAQNSYALKGTGRSGNDPAFDLTLRAPSLSLAGLTKLKNYDSYRQAHGDLHLSATLRKGMLLAEGKMGFNRVAKAERMGPESGRLLFKASYAQESDQARLESLDLIVDNLLHLHGTGKVNDLKNERNFEMALMIDDLDLQRLSALLPKADGRQLALSGRLRNTGVQLAGSARQGITAITGGAHLREVTLTKDGRPWISGLSSTVSVGKQATGIKLKVELSSRDSVMSAIESIQATFTLMMSPMLKLQNARFNLLHARLLGLALAGEASYDHSAVEAFRASLQGSSNDLATSSPLLKPYDLQIDSGKCTTSLKARGRNPNNFKAAVDLKLTEVHGRKGQLVVSLKQGTASAQLSRNGGQVVILGNSELTGLATAGKTGQARLTYRLANNLLTLEDSYIDWDGTTINLARLTAAVPSREYRQETLYYPLAIEICGGDMKHKSSDACDISGRMDGYLARSGTMKWLEGFAKIGGGKLSLQGKPVAAPLALVTFNRSGAKANISGTFLGGGLNGDVAFNPFAVAEGATFRVGIKGADLSIASPLLPPRNRVTIKEGVLEGSLDGRYSGRDGLNARIEATGGNVTLARSGKSLVSRAVISMSGDIAGQKVVIRKVSVTAGERINFTANGKLENAFSDSRQGNFNFLFAQAPLNSYVDAFVNSLPRFLQEATVSGSLAAHGTLALQKGQRLLQGSLMFSKIRLDSPGQTITMHDMDGSFPFSIDMSGTTAVTSPKSVDFTRENFQQLYQQLNRLPERSQIVSIGRIALGKVELGTLTLHVRAANGLTEIASIRSSLYGGTLLGTGTLLMKEGFNYRGDLLLSELSLTEVCNHFPKIKGYISGRINGIVSLYGEGSGISRQYGFVDLWVNEAKDEKMLVSREFLQRLGGKKLSGIFFRKDIPYDRAEISALLEQGYLSFDTLDIVHTNIFGVRDLNVSISPTQNRITLDHLIESIKQASVSGKAASGQGKTPEESAPATEFKWEE